MLCHQTVFALGYKVDFENWNVSCARVCRIVGFLASILEQSLECIHLNTIVNSLNLIRDFMGSQ